MSVIYTSVRYVSHIFSSKRERGETERGGDRDTERGREREREGERDRQTDNESERRLKNRKQKQNQEPPLIMLEYGSKN